MTCACGRTLPLSVKNHGSWLCALWRLWLCGRMCSVPVAVGPAARRAPRAGHTAPHATAQPHGHTPRASRTAAPAGAGGGGRGRGGRAAVTARRVRSADETKKIYSGTRDSAQKCQITNDLSRPRDSLEFDVRFIWKTASRRAAYESHRISPIAYRMAAVRTQCAR